MSEDSPRSSWLRRAHARDQAALQHPDQDVLVALARWIDRTRPIGPLSLRMHSRRPYLVVSAVVAALLGGAGAALAETTPAPAPGAAHRQYVARGPGGSRQTTDVQRGTVIAAGPSSVTLRSADGFTARYTVVGATIVDSGDAGITWVKPGDQAWIQATVTDGTARAARIDDLTLQRRRGAADRGARNAAARSQRGK